MPIAEVILKEAEALAAPISAADPSGKNPAGDERYQELRVEVDKESAPTGEPVRWPRVGQLGAEILQKVAKDLLVAGYMAYGMFRARGLQGLAVGFVTVDLLFERHWDGMFPPVARLKGRGTALRWLLEHAIAGVSSYSPQPADRAAINALIESSRSLRGRAREQLGDHVPSFKEWTDLLESLRQTLPPEAEAPPEPAPVAAPVAVEAPVVKDMSPGTSTPAVAASAAPAKDPPAAPAGPDPRALAAPWLAPIPGPNPAGSDATGSEEYQGLLAEVDKLQSPSGGTVAWPKVIQAGDVVLKRQAKDLRVACHLALGRYRSEGLAGLALGLSVLAEVSDEYWDTMQPPANRVRGRLGALRGLLDQLEPELTVYQPRPTDRAAIAELKVAITRLQAVLRARLADQAPPLRLLIQTVDQLAMTVVEPPPPPPPPPPPVPQARPPEPVTPAKAPPPPVTAPVAPPPVTPTPAAPAVSAPAPIAAAPSGDLANSAAIDRFLRGLGEELVKLAAALRRARSADPLAYRLIRTGLYVYIAAPPPSQADGSTSIPGVNEKERERLEAMRSNGRWAELLETCESMLPMNRYALDLHRFSAEALRGLGGDHEVGRRALLSELGALLNRLPQVLGFKDRDGAPLANDATRSWIEAEVLGGGKPGGGATGSAAPAASAAAPAGFTMPVVAAAPPGAEQAQLKALFAANKRDEALRLAAALIQQAASGREKFLRRLELAETCLDGKDPALARTLFTGLAAEIEALRLDTWEPALAVRGLDGLARSIPKNQPADKPALDVALTRLAALDPLRAATLR